MALDVYLQMNSLIDVYPCLLMNKRSILGSVLGLFAIIHGCMFVQANGH